MRRHFEQAFRSGSELQAQLCVYANGECVVDLWGAQGDAGDFGPDNLVNIFSSGKSLEAIALASLVSRGLLDYGALIVDYWPEFGGAGKGSTRVCDL
ncbi:MAG: serine hydrolase domain-containing protein, partial [Pseudomonadota bacterium]|nr:serine hydrolase domain-containing protein [Pseudomonadota bacterium]